MVRCTADMLCDSSALFLHIVHAPFLMHLIVTAAMAVVETVLVLRKSAGMDHSEAKCFCMMS